MSFSLGCHLDGYCRLVFVTRVLLQTGIGPAQYMTYVVSQNAWLLGEKRHTVVVRPT